MKSGKTFLDTLYITYRKKLTHVLFCCATFQSRFPVSVNGAFIFRKGYNARDYYEGVAELRAALDQIASGYFCPDDPHQFTEFVDHLLNYDRFKICADFQSYIECQDRVSRAFRVSFRF